MKTEEEIRKEFDKFIKSMDNKLADLSRLFHNHDHIVGWDEASPSAIDKLQKRLLDYRTAMAMRDAVVTLKQMIFEEEEKCLLSNAISVGLCSTTHLMMFMPCE